MATKKAKTQKSVEEIIEDEVGGRKGTFNPLAFYSESLDEIAVRQEFEADPMEDVPPMSTGMLALDLLMGGGIRPAWYTNFGKEQSCKTTGALTIMAAALKAKIPIVSFADYEGSTKSSRPYVSSILKHSGLKISAKDVFGRKNPSTGKWDITPMVRYRAETLGEKFFDYLADILRTLPDKKFIAGKWWLVFEDTKINKARVGDSCNTAMARKYGKGLWVEAPDGNLQAIILVDSYPAMNPTANDDDEANNSLALQARMFSKHIPRVKGRMASKMVAVVGINQLRDVPMAMYGPSENEPGGQALKFYSDVRIKFAAIKSGVPFNPKFESEDSLEHERSVTVAGRDKYRYIRITGHKNKLWEPGRKGWLRLWVNDPTGSANGFDPVFDTLFYLKETGQLVGKNRKNIYLNLDGLGKAKRTIDWVTLKTWVLGTKEEKIKICQTLGYKPLDLRVWSFKQMSTGRGEALYVEQRNSGKQPEEEE
jgi:RecA/RadA recombinase